MKWPLRVFAVILILVGIVWIFQGINVILGSFMSGHIEYTYLGIAVAIIGIGLLIFTNRRSK